MSDDSLCTFLFTERVLKLAKSKRLSKCNAFNFDVSNSLPHGNSQKKKKESL